MIVPFLSESFASAADSLSTRVGLSPAWLGFLFVAFVFVPLLGAFGAMLLRRKYFSLRDGIPGLSPQLVVGNLKQSGLVDGKTLHEVFVEWHAKFGSTASNYNVDIVRSEPVFLC